MIYYEYVITEYLNLNTADKTDFYSVIYNAAMNVLSFIAYTRTSKCY